jgi:hypothetical protein
MMSDETENNGHENDGAIDAKEARADIAAGARALKELQKTAGRNWTNGWSAVIRGWRGLRELAFKRSGSRETNTQAYRDAMSHFLGQAQNADYRGIPKETRSAMTRLIDHIDEIDGWYATLSVWDRERWTNPQTIVKHVPSHMLAGHGSNTPKPKRAAPKKRKASPEADSLREVLIYVITKYVMPVDPEDAKALLSKLYAPGAAEPDDGLEGVGEDDDGESDE